MSTTLDHKIGPSDVSPEILRQMDEILHERKAILIGADGEQVEVPQALNELFLYIVGCMQRKQSIILVPEDETMTTQAAARFLGVSRPYLVRLLDQGRIPHHRVGSHRRVTLSDLRTYQQGRDAERKKALDDLSNKIVEAGLYDKF